jgi:hypothetical protein
MDGDDNEPVVTMTAPLDMQVCVPAEWTDHQVLQFAEEQNPNGAGGWSIRRAGDRALNGDPERQNCKGRAGFVHIMLDA